MIYIGKKGNEAVFHTSLQAMRDFDGIDTPDLTVSEAEFEAAENLVRVIDGEIVLGKTDAELTAEKNANRIRVIDAELQAIDAKSGRSARAVARAIATDSTVDPADLAKLDEYERQAIALRSELTNVQTGVAG